MAQYIGIDTNEWVEIDLTAIVAEADSITVQNRSKRKMLITFSSTEPEENSLQGSELAGATGAESGEAVLVVGFALSKRCFIRFVNHRSDEVLHFSIEY